MGAFFKYDMFVHKHLIATVPVTNEKNEVVGYRANVGRFNAEKGGTIENISDKYIRLKWKVFSTKKFAEVTAMNFFNELKDEDDLGAILDENYPYTEEMFPSLK